RKNIGTEGKCRCQGRIEAGRFAEQTPAQKVDRVKERENAQSKRQSSRPVVNSEQPETCSHHPIQQRGLLQIPDTVDVKSYPVVSKEDLPGRFGMYRIGVVEESRLK